MEDLKNNLQCMYKDLVDKQISSKYLTYWSNAIFSNGKTMHDFKSSVLASDDYKNHNLDKYRNFYYKKIGFDFDLNSFEEFWKAYGQQELKDETILTYIGQLPEFVSKYSEIINRVAEACGVTNSENMTSFYLNNFRNYEKDYSIEDFQDDLERNTHVNNQAQTVLNETLEANESEKINSSQQLAVQYGLSDDDISFAKQLTGNEEELYKYISNTKSSALSPINNNTSQPCTASSELLYEFVNEFEAAFKRPIFVHEYFKYAKDCKTIHTEIQDILKKHTMSFERMKAIWRDYLNEDLREYEYVKRFIIDIDRTAFFTEIKDKIITWPEYEHAMKTSVKQKYFEMYGTQLEPYDSDYLFQSLRQNKLSVNDESIHDRLVEFKDETDEIITRIISVYSKVLDRQPDESEIDKYIQVYRDHIQAGFDSTDSVVERELISSLEFHDILKKHIKQAYFKQKGMDAIPSVLFKSLSYVLSHIQVLTIEHMPTIIEKSFSQQ